MAEFRHIVFIEGRKNISSRRKYVYIICPIIAEGGGLIISVRGSDAYNIGIVIGCRIAFCNVVVITFIAGGAYGKDSKLARLFNKAV